MSEYNELMKIIKQASVEATEAQKPVAVVFGTVSSISPLQIFVDQKTILEADELILVERLSEYNVSMSVQHMTDSCSGGTGEDSFASHSHGYSGTKSFSVHGNLKTGDKVLMMRVQGGQRHVVLDRLVSG